MRVAGQIVAFVRRLHPDQRRAVKAAMTALAHGRQAEVAPLSDDLQGYYRLRVGGFRVVFRYLDSGEISCEFIDVRSSVYERFTSMREALESRWLVNDPPSTYGHPRRRRARRVKGKAIPGYRLK